MGSKLRVLHVVVNMNRGGAETLIMNLYRNIDRTKVQFDFLTCNPGVFDEEIIQMGGRIHRIPYISDVGHFKYIRGLTRFFTEHKHYKIVHSHMDKMSGLVLRAANKAGIPYRFAHIHSTKSEGDFIAKAYKWYAGRILFQNVTHFMACSIEAINWIDTKRSDKAIIIKNGIDSARFSFSEDVRRKVRKEFGFKEGTIVLGHVGRFSVVKNHTFLIDVFSKFSREKEEAVLFLVGEGSLRKEMEKKVQKLKLETKVIFTGVRNDIDCLMQAFDFFLLPSLHEGLPVSLIEAQGAGVPCLISDRISKEVDLKLNLIQYAALENEDIWVKKLKELTGSKLVRDNHKSSLLEKGYDITSIADFLVGCYLTVSR